MTTILAMLAAMLPQMAAAAPEKRSGRYLVKARSAADYAGLRAKAVKEGARVLRDLPALKAMVVSGTAAARTSLAATAGPSAWPGTGSRRWPSRSRPPLPT